MTVLHRGAPAFGLALLAAASLSPAAETSSRIEPYHVQGNVWMLAGAASNIAVQIGDDGILVVDTGGRETRDEVLGAIRSLSTKPIRWIVNTEADLDHTGGNETVSQAGVTVNGNPAAIIAHENVLGRMSAEDRPVTEWPLNSFFESQRDFYFNGEAVFLYHIPSAHTDGDVMVYFRGSDVLVTGDLFVTTHFPVADLESGGNINGFIEGLNKALDITVPAYLQEGGTYVIPGHGRVSDEADVVEYRDMVLFVRDRVREMIDDGMSLRAVLRAKPSADYDLRYSNDAMPWTTDMFIESVYRSLSE
jgi:cyclase